MATNPTLLTMPIAENGQKNTIPATQAAAGDGLLSQSTGFPPETALPLGAGGKAPTREDFNGAFNLLSDIAFYAQKGWTFQYDATQDYFKGCLVIDPSDGLRYECINDMTAGTVSPHEDTNNDYWKVFSTGGGVAVGFIMPYAGTGLQEGWLDCDGSAVSRTMYPDLFAAIGTTWGAGDGSTTFNLPRSEDLVFQGASATNPVGTYKTAGLPNIEGGFSWDFMGYNNTPYVSARPQFPDYSGAFSVDSSGSNAYASSSGNIAGTAKKTTFDASRSNPIYGASDTVQPPAACVRFMIKAFDGQTADSALIDITQYAQDLANRLTREQTPAFNHRDVITTSGTYTAPVTGWYKITVKGGGGGGSGGYTAFAGAGGGEGGTTIAYEKLTAGDTAAIVVGAGGIGGKGGQGSAASGGNGGDSTVTVNNNAYTGGGGGGGYSPTGGNGGVGGTGTIMGAAGAPGRPVSGGGMGGSGGGNGGASSTNSQAVGASGITGGGGQGGYGPQSGTGYTKGGAGGDGFCMFEYFAES